MPDPHDTGRGLTALLGDVLAADQPDAEVLVRYADAPDSLTAAERKKVEAELAASPALRDQLRVLRNIDPARLRVADVAPERPRLIDALGTWLRRPVVLRLLPAGALAALGLLLLSPVISRRFGPVSAPPPAERDRAVLGTTGGTREVDRAGRRLQDDVGAPQVEGQAAAASEKQDTDVAALRRERPAAANAVAQASDESLRSKGAVAPPAAPAPKPVAVPFVLPPPVYRAPKVVGEGVGRPFNQPAARRDRSAVAVGKEQPAQTLSARPEAPAGTTRAAGALPGMVALAPEGVAWTATEQPTLLWFVRELPARNVDLHLRLVDDRSGKTRADVRLPPPTRTGVQRIRLRDHGLRLASDAVYRWSVSVGGGPTDTAVALGRVQRLDPPASVAAALTGAPPQQRAAIYAGAGFWYDALAALDDLREQYPQNTSVQDAFAALLEQGGLAALGRL